MADFRCTIRFGEVIVRPGDIIFGDLDGVCVIPQEIAQDVFELALEKSLTERRVHEAIRKGMTCQEAWDKFGVL